MQSGKGMGKSDSQDDTPGAQPDGHTVFDYLRLLGSIAYAATLHVFSLPRGEDKSPVQGEGTESRDSKNGE